MIWILYIIGGILGFVVVTFLVYWFALIIGFALTRSKLEILERYMTKSREGPNEKTK